MTIDPKTLLIRAPSLTTLAQAREFAKHARGGDAYVQEVFQIAQLTGYSAEIIIAQWAVETGVGTSPAWTNRYNPAGIGITDGGDVGISFASASEAAHAQGVHLSAYVEGYNYNLRRWLNLDPRYLLVLQSDWAESVKSVADLTGKWATDPHYGEKIASRVEELRGTTVGVTPDPGPSVGEITYGRVPRPNILVRPVLDSENNSWDNLGQRLVYGIVYHRQLGENWGTDAYFRQHAPGLTDYGISRVTGEILKWNDPWGVGSKGVSPNRSPWASGGPGGNSGDGIAFVQKFGREGINRFLTALEIDGWYQSDVQDAGYQSIVSLSAHLADAARVPWDKYPLNPNTGVNFVYWHNEFQGEKPCPGDVIMKLTPQIIADTKALMKKYQEG